MITKPSVGRKVWYRPSRQDMNGDFHHSKMEVIDGQPLDATIVAVWGERCVNLAVLDIYAKLHERRSVKLIHPGDPVPEYGGYCEWMPYQIKQHQKNATENDGK